MSTPDPTPARRLGPTTVAIASLAASVVVFLLKAGAGLSSGALALMADAAESALDAAMSAMVLVAVRVGRQPPDAGHPWGHGKAEYFAAGFQGALILGAGASILVESLRRLGAAPSAIELGPALGLSALAVVVSLAKAVLLVRSGEVNRSPALIADGWHAASDVATTAGTWLGLGLAWATGAWVLDPIVAGLVAVHVLWTGVRLGREAVRGLMDGAAPRAVVEAIERELAAVVASTPGARIGRLRARQSGRDTFIECVLEVPGTMAVRDAHQVCDALEAAARRAMPDAWLVVHAEPAAPVRAPPPGV